MIKKNKFNIFLFKNAYVKRLIIKLHKVIEDYFYCNFAPLLIVLMLHISPSYINKFKGVIKKSFAFISRENRIKKTDNPFDDFFIDVDGVKNFGEINIIMRGASLHGIKSKINKSLPTFYVNFCENFESDQDKLNPNIFHITADAAVFNKLKSIKFNPVILVAGYSRITGFYNGGHKLDDKYIESNHKPRFTVIHNSGTKRLQLGSGLMSIAALYKVSTAINIYGWDEYLNKDIKNMTYFEVLLSLLFKSANYKCNLPLLSEKIINYGYSARMSSVESIKMNSFLSGINKHNNLVKKIERTIYYA